MSFRDPFSEVALVTPEQAAADMLKASRDGAKFVAASRLRHLRDLRAVLARDLETRGKMGQGSEHMLNDSIRRIDVEMQALQQTIGG